MLSRLGRLLLISLITGVVIAAGALPASALAGWALANAAVPYDELPAVLRNPVTAQASYVFAKDGKTLITKFYDENRRDVTGDQVAQVMRDAVIAAEDNRFYEHNGVDVKGVLRAIVANGASGQVSQGASTLTMQYVRNVLKSDPHRTEEERKAATEVSGSRKIQEARYALALEERLSKDDILERYLNIAYFGSGAYGIYAASQVYFSKEPSALTLPEAALLAGLLQSPESLQDVERATARRSYVLSSMVRTGAITQEQATAADQQKVVYKRSSSASGCVAARAGWGFFCDYFQQWWNTQETYGATPQERQVALTQGGYLIVTTLDPAIQNTAQQQVNTVYGKDSRYVAPMAVVEPGTGNVRALAVNRNYAPSGKGNTMDQLVAGGDSVSGYPAGSTFKMFTMLAALEAGYSLNTGYDSPTRIKTKWPETGKVSCDGYWCPENDNPQWMNGYRTMWDGFGRSVNTYFVQLEQEVGAEKVVEMAQRLGIKFRDPKDASDARDHAATWGTFTLGFSNTTPLDLANAYATLAADGRYCAPLPVRSVTNGTGVAIPVGPTCRQVISPEVARAAIDAARCPVGQQSDFGRCNGGTATAVDDIMEDRPIAGKTGSSDGNKTESFVAITPQLAAAMITANPAKPTDAVGSAILSKVYRAVARTIATSLAGQPVIEFTAPNADTAFSYDDSNVDGRRRFR